MIDAEGTVHFDNRTIRVPVTISPEAQTYLATSPFGDTLPTFDGQVPAWAMRDQLEPLDEGSNDRPLLGDGATVTGISPPRLDLLLSESYELLHKAYLGITNNEQKISETFDGLHRTLHASGEFFEHNQGKLDHIIITAARTVNKGVVDVEENESRERLKIHAVSLIWYMGKGTEGLQMLREEFEAGNEGIVSPTQLRWLANLRTIRERRQNVEIAKSFTAFGVKRSMVVQNIIKYGIKAMGLWN